MSPERERLRFMDQCLVGSRQPMATFTEEEEWVEKELQQCYPLKEAGITV